MTEQTDSLEQEARKKVQLTLNELGLSFSPPDKNEIDEIFQLSTTGLLEAMALNQVAKSIIILSQYLIFLSYKINMAQIRKTFLSKKFERALMRGIADLSGTKEERKRQLIDSSPELLLLEKELDLIEIELTLMENLPETVREYINALKKYRDTKEYESRIAKFED